MFREYLFPISFASMIVLEGLFIRSSNNTLLLPRYFKIILIGLFALSVFLCGYVAYNLARTSEEIYSRKWQKSKRVMYYIRDKKGRFMKRRQRELRLIEKSLELTFLVIINSLVLFYISTIFSFALLLMAIYFILTTLVFLGMKINIEREES